MPQEAKMGHLWDGAVRSMVETIYLSKGGVVVGAPADEPAYYDTDRPNNAPLASIDPYWCPLDEHNQPKP